MKAVLIRTGSVPANSPTALGSSKFSILRSVSGVFSGEKITVSSPRISMCFDVNHRRYSHVRGIRRVLSESDVVRSGDMKLSGAGSRSFPSRIPEEEYLSESSESEDNGGGSVLLKDNDGLYSSNYAGEWPGSGIPIEELGFSEKYGGGGGDDYISNTYFGGNRDRSSIRDYYEKTLNSNPGDSLLLRNYGKYLHEVEKDSVRAEECYGRAILASPGDGELLSLYGKLVWETQRDEERAKSYFDRAVYASPDDCTVLGSYAHFMWEAEEEDEVKGKADEESPALIAVF